MNTFSEEKHRVNLFEWKLIGNYSSKFELVKKTNTRMSVDQSLCDILYCILSYLCEARKY